MASAYLSAKAKQELFQWVAANGENYDAYLRYARARGWEPPFTRSYLHTWIQRHKGYIRVYRMKHEQEVRKATVLDKMARVRALERAIGLLDEKIEECEEPELLMRLLEQQRKHLQRKFRDYASDALMLASSR